ncbi:MAG: sulfatase [Verrucomicrobiales bacterium]|nr:sulfatase [Verrucomicrobiales bacterium]
MLRLLALPALLILIGLSSAAEKPNIVVIYADDLGYGDLSCYGHPTIHTPHLDRMAAEGVRFTEFYSAAEVCTPSRAALLTGRYPVRSGMASSKRRVLFPESKGGLPPSEITLATALHGAGYATAAVGKWHLGHLSPHLPTDHGFDSYFGIPYSNDMDRRAELGPRGRAAFLEPKSEYWNVPLMRDKEILERAPDQTQLTRRYTDEAVKFIRSHREGPFFLYLAHSMPHVPLFRSKAFEGISRRGLYGDVVQEVDASVGRVLDTLKELGLQQRTLVVFSSDNGPWLIFDQQGGSAGLLRDGKGSTWEGGMRVPGIFWWPDTIPAGQICRDWASTMDIFATGLAIAGVPLPADRTIDGQDIRPLLTGGGSVPREGFFYYRGTDLFAARTGPWKAHWKTQTGYGQKAPDDHQPPLLFQLDVDPGESWSQSETHAAEVSAIDAAVARHRATLKPVENQLEK